MLPVDLIADGNLHRFSFKASDGTEMRFLVIHKGSGVFGVGLDACQFCGVAGYIQKGKDIVCTKCGARINIPTIGFPGGCNPLPLESYTEGNSLVIPLPALETQRKVFQ